MHWHLLQLKEVEMESKEFVEALEASDVVPLCIVAWSKTLDDVVVAMCNDGWDELDANQETVVFNKFGTMALDFAPLMTDLDE
jgi:hypothetical protein